MRLVRIGAAGEEVPAALVSDEMAVDLTPVVGADLSPAALSRRGRERIIDAVADGGLPPIDVAGLRLGAPVPRPPKLVCIGLNYVDHAAESGAPLPDEPIVFFKAPNTVIGPRDELLLPIGGEKTDWEVELAVVIGETARYLPDENAALATIAGYCVSHDVSERAFQLERGGQWVKGKSCETFNPLGPWLVTADELEDVGNLDLWLDVNGEPMQRGTSSDMIFPVPYLIWYLSQFMVLEPGDVINTGTPAGVALGMETPRYLREGDVVELGIDGLGHQRTTCRQATA
jgi:2-keto-4-pentenoate hydratase/2-oxohepta-3-ene-1,7-dioic acid hydratase in catechol pathway